MKKELIAATLIVLPLAAGCSEKNEPQKRAVRSERPFRPIQEHKKRFTEKFTDHAFWLSFMHVTPSGTRVFISRDGEERRILLPRPEGYTVTMGRFDCDRNLVFFDRSVLFRSDRINDAQAIPLVNMDINQHITAICKNEKTELEKGTPQEVIVKYRKNSQIS